MKKKKKVLNIRLTLDRLRNMSIYFAKRSFSLTYTRVIQNVLNLTQTELEN